MPGVCSAATLAACARGFPSALGCSLLRLRSRAVAALLLLAATTPGGCGERPRAIERSRHDDDDDAHRQPLLADVPCAWDLNGSWGTAVFPDELGGQGHDHLVARQRDDDSYGLVYEPDPLNPFGDMSMVDGVPALDMLEYSRAQLSTCNQMPACSETFENRPTRGITGIWRFVGEPTHRVHMHCHALPDPNPLTCANPAFTCTNGEPMGIDGAKNAAYRGVGLWFEER